MAQTVSVTEVMSTEYLGVSEGDSVAEVAGLLRDHREDTAVVIRGGEPVGLATSLDLLAVLDEGERESPIDEHMHAPVETVDAGATIAHAADRLLTAAAGRLVVTDLDGRATGVIAPIDVLNATETLLEGHLEATVPTDGRRNPPSLSDQGMCESCGRLADTLHEADGAMLCPTCADL